MPLICPFLFSHASEWGKKDLHFSFNLLFSLLRLSKEKGKRNTLYLLLITSLASLHGSAGEELVSNLLTTFASHTLPPFCRSGGGNPFSVFISRGGEMVGPLLPQESPAIPYFNNPTIGGGGKKRERRSHAFDSKSLVTSPRGKGRAFS